MLLLIQIIVFSLKRFSRGSSSFRSMGSSKINTLIHFPITGLDLSSQIIGKQEHSDLIYDLFAVSNHIGGTGGGHCLSKLIPDTAYAKNALDAHWYLFDDSCVRRVSESDLVVSALVLCSLHRHTCCFTFVEA